MDLFILKTDVEKFTSTNKKTLHLIFKGNVVVLDESPCPRGSQITNLQVLVLGLQTPRKFSMTACVFETVFV